jgi:hypothetical protein
MTDVAVFFRCAECESSSRSTFAKEGTVASLFSVLKLRCVSFVLWKNSRFVYCCQCEKIVNISF